MKKLKKPAPVLEIGVKVIGHEIEPCEAFEPTQDDDQRCAFCAAPKSAHIQGERDEAKGL
jgi:hypothetical protein